MLCGILAHLITSTTPGPTIVVPATLPHLFEFKTRIARPVISEPVLTSPLRYRSVLTRMTPCQVLTACDVPPVTAIIGASSVWRSKTKCSRKADVQLAIRTFEAVHHKPRQKMFVIS